MEQEQLIDLASRENKLLAEHGDLANFCRDEVASDKEWSTERLNNYEAHAKQALVVASEIEIVRGKIEREEQRKASRRPFREQSALGRATRMVMEGKAPANGLEEWEAKRFLPTELDPAKDYPVNPSDCQLHFTLEADETSISPFQNLEAVVPASDTDDNRKIVPRMVEPGIVHARKAYGSVGATVERIPTADGNNRTFLYRDATARGNIRTAQGVAIAAKDPATFPSLVYSALDTDSGEMKLQRQFINDVQFDVDAEIRREGLNRIGRSWNLALTSRVAGLSDTMQAVKQMGAGHSTNTVSKTTFTTDNLVDAMFEMDEYLGDSEGWEFTFPDDVGAGMTTWQAHRTAIAQMWKLKDGNQRPLLQMADTATAARGIPMTLYGIPVMRNNDLDSFASGAATGAVPMLLMNGRYFMLRLVGAPEVFVFWDSRTAISNGMQLSYLVYHRRFFGPTGAITAGDGKTDSTRSDAISILATP